MTVEILIALCFGHKELGVYLYIIKGLIPYAAHHGSQAAAFVTELNARCAGWRCSCRRWVAAPATNAEASRCLTCNA